MTPADALVAQPVEALPAEPGTEAARAVILYTQHGMLPAVQSLLYIIIVALFIVSFSAQPFRIPSGSMEPTLLVGDFVLVDKELARSVAGPLAPASIHRGDVVVFHFPVNPSMHLVKRVIGLPGERVRLRGGRVFINDAPLTEPYASYRPSRPDSFRDNFPYTRSTDPDVNAHWWIEMQRLLDNGDLRIPAGSFFVLGDNRNDSEDSRYWGLVPAGAIVGKPLLVYLSLRQPGVPDPSSDPGNPGPESPETPVGGSPASPLPLARWRRTLHIVR